jgi:hypothetical protein
VPRAVSNLNRITAAVVFVTVGGGYERE